MSKLPRDYYAPDSYDYDGDTEAMYEDWKTYFDPENENESSVVKPFPDACPICRDGNYCNCSHSEEYNDYSYDQMDDFCEYCSRCGIHVPKEGHYISADTIVCKCSPLYPDLRPSDYPHKICSCGLVKYEYLGETICSCSSPDLYALLKRQHELNLTFNLGSIYRKQQLWEGKTSTCDIRNQREATPPPAIPTTPEPPPALEESDNEEQDIPF